MNGESSVLVGVFLLVVMGLGGCASVAVSPAEQALRVSPAVVDVQKDLAAFKGQRVRWGGSIIGVTNLKDETHIELLTRLISTSGKVAANAAAQGRILVRVNGFLDPVEYPVGRALTVVGEVVDVVTQPVGEYPYPHVLVEMESLHLWQDVSRSSELYLLGHGFYDPFFHSHHRHRPHFW